MNRASELTVKKFFEENRHKLKLELLGEMTGEERLIVESELHRPGLALAGFIELFTYKRIQVLGNTEIRYLASLDDTSRDIALANLFKFQIPCVVVTDSNDPPKRLLEIATEQKICVFRSPHPTTVFYHLVSDYLQEIFAERTTLHGTLVDVFGIGLLFTGRSGIGKSEIALDLVERGHRLVSDDMVFVTKRHEEILMGEGRDISEHLMEIRGLGLIDVKRIYGIWAVRVHKRIEVVIELVDFDSKADYDRTGLDAQSTKILDVDIPLIVLPINPGKNITVIAETIAMNHMLKLQGINTAQEFNQRLLERMRKKGNKRVTPKHEDIKRFGSLEKDFE